MPNLEDALVYAKRGWYIVPDHTVTDARLCTCNDTTCTSIGKHPRIDRESAEGPLRNIGSVDPAVLSRWWRMWPDSNIAIVCGKISGLIAIDIDPRNGGLHSWAQLINQHGMHDNTIVSKSGGGGRHILFAHPRFTVVRNRIGLAPGIDVKGDGGRIVAPPSNHISGNKYEWDDFSKRVSLMPAWLLDMIQNQKGTGTRQAMRESGMRI